MSSPAEAITIAGITTSWYCSRCGRELGAELDVKDGMPPAGCPERGHADLAWETWNVETSPTYPHDILHAAVPD